MKPLSRSIIGSACSVILFLGLSAPLFADPPATQTAADFRKAAEGGDAVAMYSVGCCYQRGTGGVAVDLKAAVDWYTKSANAGDTDAMNNLGWLYQNGMGVSADDTQALIWYRKAAEGHSSAGMFNLGWMYENGRGVAKDEATAVEWYKKSADAGEPRAMNRLGVAASLGLAGPRDYSEAYMARFLRAAEAGNSDGMFNLGWLYHNGLGQQKNEFEAYSWFRQARLSRKRQGDVLDRADARKRLGRSGRS